MSKGLARYFEYEVIDVDGARVLLGDGWGLVRASNTQPVLVARCEARTPEGLQRICNTIRKPWPGILKLSNSGGSGKIVLQKSKAIAPGIISGAIAFLVGDDGIEPARRA
jgi:hypothetical protein